MVSLKSRYIISSHDTIKKQRMLEAGKAIHKKGRPSKSDNGIPPSIWTIVNKVDRKNRKIK